MKGPPRHSPVSAAVEPPLYPPPAISATYRPLARARYRWTARQRYPNHLPPQLRCCPLSGRHQHFPVQLQLIVVLPMTGPPAVPRSAACCCPLAPANHSASGLAINICDVLVEEGGPRVEAKRRGGDPLPRCQVQSQTSGASGQQGLRMGGRLMNEDPRRPPIRRPAREARRSDERLAPRFQPLEAARRQPPRRATAGRLDEAWLTDGRLLANLRRQARCSPHHPVTGEDLLAASEQHPPPGRVRVVARMSVLAPI